MGLLTVEGTYRDGQIVLDEKPRFAREESRVIVTFAPAEGEQEASRTEIMRRIVAGMDMGFKLGGAPYATREEIYDERIHKIL